MASEWRKTTLGEVIELKRGYDLPTKSRRPGPFPVVSSSGPTDTHAESKAKAPGVVTGRYGTIGEVYYITTDYWPLNTALYVKDFKGNNPRFVSYFLRAIDFVAYSDKSAVPGVNRNHLHQAKVNVPPLPVQQRIADVLGKLDDKIELNRRMNRTLEKMAAAIFKSWFIDFDPVHAKAEGRDANLPADIADLFPDAFEDSALGSIPRGWTVKALTEAVTINPKRTLAKGTLAPFLEMSNMPTRGPSPDAWRMREMTSGTKFIDGDTLVARITPCLENGKTAFVDFLHDGQVGWGSTEYIVLRPCGVVPPVFAYLLARTPSFRTFAIRQMTGSSGRQRVPPQSLSKFQLALPEFDSPVYRALGDMTQPFFARIRLAMMQNRRLAGLRDTLLPKLLSGEIELPAAEAIAEEGA